MANESTSPAQLILLNDVEMPSEMRVDVLESIVCQYVEGGSCFQIRINALNSADQQLKWIDADELAPGAKVEIQMGYLGALETVIVGEITGLHAEFPSDRPATLLVQGFDRLHRLRRGRSTRVLAQLKDSQIAEQIAGEHGLTADVEDTRVVHEYVLQDNLSDLDFLLERARRIRFEVLVDDQTLVFRAAANHLGEVAQLEYMTDLMSLSVRLTTVEQTSEVLVRGWSPDSKQALLGVGRAGDETTRMDGAEIGAEIAEQAFSATSTAIVDIPVYSQAEADQIAAARFNDMAIGLLSGTAQAVGRTDLRAGTTVRLTGIGDRFTGPYYVTMAQHRLGPEVGYLVDLELARSGS